MERVEQIADEHTTWASGFFQWVYRQAFLHGYKHGYEDAMKKKRKE